MFIKFALQTSNRAATSCKEEHFPKSFRYLPHGNRRLLEKMERKRNVSVPSDERKFQDLSRVFLINCFISFNVIESMECKPLTFAIMSSDIELEYPRFSFYHYWK